MGDLSYWDSECEVGDTKKGSHRFVRLRSEGIFEILSEDTASDEGSVCSIEFRGGGPPFRFAAPPSS
ncbi:hypothetical protein IE81DRAFT_63792 [Ceraceosorus guamensis]|uniref:Uncharacterized protein n=1 Tax=Ceraceosorus guamensis TaxID=1522189 RepID=A0A316VMX8_9BASI|nr:hypothetical protein IE81DRAFT_63792 [Ceraceosorus guamensis]PWN38932.1 hypothetical protein IE81DRAFT_63792 [Ceraceosorus guamensis]